MLNIQKKKKEAKEKYKIIKTLTFEITQRGQKEMAKKILEMEKYGWKEKSRITEAGRYKGGKGCCLFCIFMPLVLLAGHNKDKVIITFEKYISEEEKLRHKMVIKKKQKNIIKIIYLIIIILLSFWIWYLTVPSIAIWYLWEKTNLEKNKKQIITGLILLIFFIFGVYKLCSMSDKFLTIIEPQNNVII
ncbi:MAG: hypothetical protein U9O55_02750 [Patescibacteria group bacterium]|nr:hypothetical protein [Patescibacteria group bacterium]